MSENVHNSYGKLMSDLKTMETNGMASPNSNISVAPIEREVVTVMGGVGMGVSSVGPKPMQMTCPHCRCRITTRITHRSTAKTHLACILLSWTGCCCCLPYCMDTCRNANHFCPMCGAFVGTYSS